MDPRRMRLMLEENGVELFRVGRRMCVPLSELVTKLRHFWESDEVYEKLRDVDPSKTD
jgi:hypothetical protein